ncbi:MAG: histidine kinase [Gemmatimonadota bacterium]|nr:histidine kinase [Gemmatimonadota bacterium]
MLQAPNPAQPTELEAAILQAGITFGLTVLCGLLYRRYRKPYFKWWAVAWGLYVLRLGFMMAFLSTRDVAWLFWHQAATGWTAIALLWAALVFSRGVQFRPAYAVFLLFPPVWAWLAIQLFDRFLLVAIPAVLFMSFATLWTGWVFLSDARTTGSRGSALLAGAFLLWGIHHLDYPILRAQGALNPWSYYFDILFTLSVGVGILTLVLEDTQRGLTALSALSGDARRGESDDMLAALLARPLTLRGVRGSAMYLRDGDGGHFALGVGKCSDWTGTRPEGEIARTIGEAVTTGHPVVARDRDGQPETYAYTAALPVTRGDAPTGALVIVGDARDPFTVLDDQFLVALGEQVGSALEHADLNRRLRQRTRELERLSSRMIQQHEEERRRLSLELHDETAQVFSSLKMQLGIAREEAPPALVGRLDRSLDLVEDGMVSIRSVTRDLRPAMLDDLGLLPVLRSLVADFAGRTGIKAEFRVPAEQLHLPPGADVAVYRAVQEALSNVAAHSGASRVTVELRQEPSAAHLVVEDDGRGPDPAFQLATLESRGHLGLTGMRERMTALGGELAISGGQGRGFRLETVIPSPGATTA